MIGSCPDICHLINLGKQLGAQFKSYAYLHLDKTFFQGVFTSGCALCTGQSVLHAFHPGPHVLQGLLQPLMLLQGQLAAPELLLGHSEQVLVVSKNLGAQASLLPAATALFTEELSSLGKLIEGLSKANRKDIFLIPTLNHEGEGRWVVDVGGIPRQELTADMPVSGKRDAKLAFLWVAPNVVNTITEFCQSYWEV